MPKQQRLLTAEEYAALPDTDEYRRDLIRGVLGVREPPASYDHGRIQFRIGYLLNAFTMPRRLGEVVVDPGFVLETNPDTVCAPDVSFVAADRVPPPGTRPYPRGAPDLAVEVLSPSNGKKAMARKIALYLNAGARLVWCVDPSRRIVTVHRPNQDPVILTVDDRLSGEDVLPGFECPVASVFDPSAVYGT